MYRKKPCLSIIIFSYNQEKYIEKAVLSALNQNYDNLEVLVSDDNSSDNTFLIVQNIKKKYCGSHRFIIHQNNQNLGLAGNIRQGVFYSTGNFIIMAAGDDISSNDRALVLSEIIQSKRNASAIYTDYTFLESDLKNDCYQNMQLNEVGSLHMALNCGGVGKGATYCFRRDVFEAFDPLPDYIKSEDKILPFVASLIGVVYHCSRKTIYYRQSENSLSNQLSKTKQLALQDPRHIQKLIEIARFKMVQDNEHFLKIKIRIIILCFNIYYQNSISIASRNSCRKAYYCFLYYFLRIIHLISTKSNKAYR